MCLVQVYGVGDGDLRRMLDFRGASGPEMQGWPAVEGLFSASVATSEPVGTLDRGLECRSGGGWPSSVGKAHLLVGEWRPAGVRASCGF